MKFIIVFIASLVLSLSWDVTSAQETGGGSIKTNSLGNRPPVAVSDRAVTTMETPVVIPVLANDSDPDGNLLTITKVTQGANGTVVITTAGTVLYRPNAGFVGTNTFTYTISDGHGGTAMAGVTVEVRSPGPGPWPLVWQPVLKQGQLLQDPANDVYGMLNVVSDPTHAAAYVANDGASLYFRLRLDWSPWILLEQDTGINIAAAANAVGEDVNGSWWRPSMGWGVEWDTDQDLNDYEALIRVDWNSRIIFNDLSSGPDVIRWGEGTVTIQVNTQQRRGDPMDPTEKTVFTYSPLMRQVRVVVADTKVNGTQDYFLDWYVPYADFKTATGVGDFTPVRTFWGSAVNDRALGPQPPADLVGGTDLYTMASDYMILIGTPGVIHRIVLSSGWNIISSFVQPDITQLNRLLSDITPPMVVLKNGKGQVYWPDIGLDAIGKWDYHQGYKIYLQGTDTLTVVGNEVVPEVTLLPLGQGWNLVAYLRNQMMPVEIALARLGNALVIAKNNAGQVYWPAARINTMGSMKPGQGYKLYLSQAATLVYPANERRGSGVIVTKPVVGAEVLAEMVPSHYRSVVANTGASATLLVEGEALRDGDEIGVWTTKRVLIGSGVVQHGQTVLTLWGDNTMTEERVEGAVDGESLSLTLWSVSETTEQELSLAGMIDALTGAEIAGQLRYVTDAAWMARVQWMQARPVAFHLAQNTPNPFNPSTVILYEVPSAGRVTLEVYNLLGQRVGMVVNEEQQEGMHEVVFENPKLASGVYIYRLQAGTLTETRKMLIMR